MHAMNHPRAQAVRLLAALFSAASIATAISAGAAEANVARIPPANSTRAPMIGVATGETVNGVPVYRLPAVTVTVNRNVELARIAQEEKAARAKRDHPNVSATSPVTPPAAVGISRRPT